jgi:uncharacterized protein YbjT (DUF2867 family)
MGMALAKHRADRLLITDGTGDSGTATAKLAVARAHKVVIANINARSTRAVAHSLGRGARSIPH